jgi:hypothetical protein
MMMEYSLHSRDYLKRARSRLDDGSEESLFYAAFELRCGIEARLAQYEDALLGITKGKSAGWEIPKLVRNIEKVYQTGDMVLRVDFQDEKGSRLRRSMYYTPVTQRLQAMGGKLGELLHCPKNFQEMDDAWWKNKRVFLEDVFRELQKANKGNILCIPIWNENKNVANIVTEPTQDETIEQQMQSVGKVGERLHVRVHHCEGFPSEL